MNVILKDSIQFGSLFFDSKPMTLEEAIPIYHAMVKNYRRGLTEKKPVLVDMNGNEVTVD